MNAQPFIAKLNADIALANERAVQDIGGLVASVTNLTLAIELYLKGLLLWNSVPAPKTHDLPTLYKLLPASVAASVQVDFVRQLELAAPVNGIELELTRANDAQERNPEPTGPPDMSLSAVLTRNADAFVIWRYLFSLNPKPGSEYLAYEHDSLNSLANALRAQYGQVHRLRPAAA